MSFKSGSGPASTPKGKGKGEAGGRRNNNVNECPFCGKKGHKTRRSKNCAQHVLSAVVPEDPVPNEHAEGILEATSVDQIELSDDDSLEEDSVSTNLSTTMVLDEIPLRDEED
mmetsp:Transcript_11399/g.32383  ORF Transcript_11399/g.32383 Transcript_11399/m.32383 type:complete len:113 (+) Transcript_11399:443-781(+)